MHFVGSISTQGTRWRHSLAYTAICEVSEQMSFCIDLCVPWPEASLCFALSYLGLLLANVFKCAVLQAADWIEPKRFRCNYSGNYPSLFESCSTQLLWLPFGHWIVSGRKTCEDASKSLMSSPRWAFSISPKSYVCSLIEEMCSESFWLTSRCYSVCQDSLHRLGSPTRSHHLHHQRSYRYWCHRMD